MPSWGPGLVNKLISISISIVNKVVTKLWLCLLPGMQTTISSMPNVQYKKRLTGKTSDKMWTNSHMKYIEYSYNLVLTSNCI